MEELLKALTRAANAVADYYEGKGKQPVAGWIQKEMERVPTTTPGATPALSQPEKPKGGRPRKSKSEETVHAEHLTPLARKRIADLTEEESAKEVFEYAKMMVKIYNKPGALGPDGQPAAEGFHLVKDTLSKIFKVGKTADLVHAQRLQYMAIMAEHLAKAQTGAAAAQPVAAVAVGIGV